MGRRQVSKEQPRCQTESRYTGQRTHPRQRKSHGRCAPSVRGLLAATARIQTGGTRRLRPCAVFRAAWAMMISPGVCAVGAFDTTLTFCSEAGKRRWLPQVALSQSVLNEAQRDGPIYCHEWIENVWIRHFR